MVPLYTLLFLASLAIGNGIPVELKKDSSVPLPIPAVEKSAQSVSHNPGPQIQLVKSVPAEILVEKPQEQSPVEKPKIPEVKPEVSVYVPVAVKLEAAVGSVVDSVSKESPLAAEPGKESIPVKDVIPADSLPKQAAAVADPIPAKESAPVDSVVQKSAAEVVPQKEEVKPVQSVPEPAVEKSEKPVVGPVVSVPQSDVSVEFNSVEPPSTISEPLDQATRMLIILEEQVNQYLPSADEGKNGPSQPEVPQTYSAGPVGNQWLVIQRQQDQIQALIDQVNNMGTTLETTITDLVTRRSYVTAALLRSVLNYNRRVRVSLERLQNRLQSLQVAATATQNSAGSGSGNAGAPPAPVTPSAQVINTIRDGINSITAQITSLVNRVRSTFNTPGQQGATGGSRPSQAGR